ncbi:MAG: hypothetical protein LBD98_02090 [Endomicrobium sp.]|nr:hypothetical protein [Endomicrobium sp.]
MIKDLKDKVFKILNDEPDEQKGSLTYLNCWRIVRSAENEVQIKDALIYYKKYKKKLSLITLINART